MSLAFRCEVCDIEPKWSLLRRGDAVTTWACDAHLPVACLRLQRDHELTELVVQYAPKVWEWAEIDKALRTIAKEEA